MTSLPRHRDPVILVDNGSTDGTLAAVAGFPHVQVVELSRNHGAVARNVGVAMARTPYVAFADDDSWWAPGALDRAVALFDADPALGLIAARIMVGPDDRLDPASAEMARSPLPGREDSVGTPVLGFVACGSLVRREAFLEAGGFDDVVFFAGEEERLALDLAARGWRLAYVDDVVAHHHPASHRPTSVQRARRIVRNSLLTAVMRRPWPVVVSTAWSNVASGWTGLSGVACAAPRLRRALRARHRLPMHVEAQRQLLSRTA
ncbi:MAG TPA: glycosyltransferase [Nocardioidaceae bacterium]|nr:glycosyltransferase [Nocardioidaceae bacterium]